MRPLGLNDVAYLVFAARWTVLLSLWAFAGGAVIGALIAMLRTAPARPLRWLAIGYIRLFQGTPLLLQLFLAFFGGAMLGAPLDAYTSAIIGLSLNAGAFLGEIWRGAIQSVPGGQVEAARALGLSYRARLLRVVLPQALRIAIAPTVGFMVNLVKSTSLAAVIGFVELTQAGKLLNNSTFRPFTVFGIVAGVYFLLCWPLTLASRRLERRLGRAYKR